MPQLLLMFLLVFSYLILTVIRFKGSIEDFLDITYDSKFFLGRLLIVGFLVASFWSILFSNIIFLVLILT